MQRGTRLSSCSGGEVYMASSPWVVSTPLQVNTTLFSRGCASDLKDSSRLAGDKGRRNSSKLQRPVNGNILTKASTLVDLQWSTTLDRAGRTGPPIVNEFKFGDSGILPGSVIQMHKFRNSAGSREIRFICSASRLFQLQQKVERPAHPPITIVLCPPTRHFQSYMGAAGYWLFQGSCVSRVSPFHIQHHVRL
jgi:hypothetical protein